MTSSFIHPIDHARAQEDKPFKHTFFRSERLLLGLNSLMPGQRQRLHDHPQQDKFYFVLAGRGRFTVGEENSICGPGDLIVAPAGVAHGVVNEGETLLSFLTAIAPAPA